MAALRPFPTTLGTTQAFGGGGGGDASLNVAVTVFAALIVTLQLPVPEQPEPDQPANVEPEAADAVKVTLVPGEKFPEHVAPQSIPAGELVTVPLPLPATDTDSG